MLDGVIAVCPSCGGEVAAVGGVKGVVRSEDVIIVGWRHKDCGFVGRTWFETGYFKRTVAPALRWWAKQSGRRPLTAEELAVKEFEIDLEVVEAPVDLLLHWRAQKPSTVPLEVKRGE